MYTGLSTACETVAKIFSEVLGFTATRNRLTVIVNYDCVGYINLFVVDPQDVVCVQFYKLL